MIDELEFHDSKLLDVVHDGRDLVLEIDAYVHRVMIRDGRELDTGWMLRVRLVVCGGVAPPGWPDLPKDYQTASGGTVRVDAVTYSDLVPLDLDATGTVEVSVEIAGRVLSITGTRVRIVQTGEARYVEDVPWEQPEE